MSCPSPTRAPGLGATNHSVPVSEAYFATKQHHCFSLGLIRLAPHFQLHRPSPHLVGTMSAGEEVKKMAAPRADPRHPGFLSMCNRDSQVDSCFSGPAVHSKGHLGQCLSGSQWGEMSNILLPSSQLCSAKKHSFPLSGTSCTLVSARGNREFPGALGRQDGDGGDTQIARERRP